MRALGRARERAEGSNLPLSSTREAGGGFVPLSFCTCRSTRLHEKERVVLLTLFTHG